MVRTVKAPDERRSEMIECAQRLFFSKGYESTSVRDIVDAMGVAKGTFYYYFDSKQAVLEAVVDEMAAQSVAMMREIVEDEQLNALQKWNKAMLVLADWKTERKNELVALLRMLQRDENALLNYKIRTRMPQMIVPVLAEIVEQGIREGVFSTRYAVETTEVVLSVLSTFSTTFADILLDPGRFDEPVELARRMLSAVEDSIERVLGAASGTLQLIDDQNFAAWFEDHEVTQRESVL